MDRHVVFIHGVRSAKSKVWMSSGSSPEVWPLWLVEDIARLGVWSVEHDSAPTLWRGHAMGLVDRANNILPRLLAEARLREGEISFVAHSFGGLIVEQLLRVANDRATSEPDVADFVSRIRRVTFLGTPHLGADAATWARRSLLALPSSATRGLGRNDPDLRGLNQWYRRFGPENEIATQTLTETRSTWLGLVVKADSSDPGLPSTPIPVEADHFSIASPGSRTSEVYIHVRDFLKTPVPVRQRKITVVDSTLDAIERDSKQTVAALERIEQTLAASTTSPLARPEIPNFLVDTETAKRVLWLRRVRMIPPPDLQAEVSKLIKELIQGELAAASPALKAMALAWCARLQFARPDKSEALLTLEAARSLAQTEEVSIAAAFAESYTKDLQTALGTLAALSSAAARSAAFIIVGNNKTAVEALEWLQS